VNRLLLPASSLHRNFCSTLQHMIPAGCNTCSLQAAAHVPSTNACRPCYRDWRLAEAAGVRAGARIGQGTAGVEVRLASGGALLPLPRAGARTGQCLALLPRRSKSRADANWAAGRPELEQGLLRRSGAERRAGG
jgi:hypothetical protein